MSNNKGTHVFEPIKGEPRLFWKGKYEFKETPYYPAQLKESYGNDVEGWRNKLYWGDNLQVMSHLLKEYTGKISLIYLDPPFDSKADYKKKIELRGQTINSDISGFEEKQYGDIWVNDDYLQFMYERLILCRELLSNEGCIYLHCDWHRSHYLRLIFDEIFGYNNFINEIIWCYTGPGYWKDKFVRKHDTILFFSKSKKYHFNPQFVEYKSGIHVNKTGIVTTYGGGVKESNSEELEQRGKPVEDYWSDIYTVDRVRSEMIDYPTQKPEALLERIIKASSNPGDLVFDCFMGSGTTQAVAMKLGRRFIGADINLGAVQTTTKRLLKVADELNGQLPQENPTYTGFEVYNVNDYEFFRNELEAKRLICDAMGMDQLADNNVYDALLDGRKVCILGINRIATASEFTKLLNNINISEWQEKQKEHPTKPVEEITFVCMGHDPNLKAQFEEEVSKMGFKVDVEIIDLLRDKKDLRFKRDSDAKVVIKGNKLVIKNFYPMNLLQN